MTTFAIYIFFLCVVHRRDSFQLAGEQLLLAYNFQTPKNSEAEPLQTKRSTKQKQTATNKKSKSEVPGVRIEEASREENMAGRVW